MAFQKYTTKLLTVITCILLCSGCATTNSFYSYNLSASKAAERYNFVKSYINVGKFSLTSYSKITHPGAPIHVYIEGDGVAWVSRSTLSKNPTPKRPLVINLATADKAENVIYIARPGQYEKGITPSCDSAYWSDKRFSNEVIDAINKVINHYLDITNSNEIHLIGYSGGAAIAVLIASRRDDIESLRTIAGNLDTDLVNKIHKVSAMKESLNPIDYAKEVSGIPQIHFVGSKDNIIPIEVAENFVTRSGLGTNANIVKVEKASHSSGWLSKWPKLLTIPAKRPITN